MIVFKHIKWKNFLSSGNTWVEMPLNKTTHTLIVGDNGSGKSTLLDALSFALFGKAHRSVKKDQLINSINKKQCEIEVEFSIGKNEYKIIRGIKPTKFEIYINGELENQEAHARDYQALLEKNILKLNHKSFHQIVVLGSSSFVPFMQLPTVSRREIIEDLLNIAIFSKMNKVVSKQKSAIKSSMDTLKHAIDISDSKIAVHENHLKTLNTSNKEKKKEKTRELDKIDLEIISYQDKNALLSLEGRDEVRAEVSTLEEEKDKASLLINSLTTQMNKIKKDIAFYSKNSVCPTCQQDITKDSKDTKLAEIDATSATIIESYEYTSTQLKRVKKELAEKQTILNAFRETEQAISLNKNTIQNLNNNRNSVLRELESFDVSTGNIADIEKELKTIKEEKSISSESYKGVLTEFEYNKLITELLKDTGIKTKVVKQYIPVINQIINKYLDKLDFFAHFTLDEEFNENIKSRHRDSYTYDSFSEGEKTKIDLSLLFTWREIAKMNNSIRSNLLILDETFDSSLDFDGVENLTKLLYDEGENINTFIISHKHELKEKFENIIEFSKTDNFSNYKAV